MISIVIPAYNESSVIVRCINSLLDGAQPGEIEVIVVCNGCRDNTAELARSINNVEVIETDVPSKSNALNLGDRRASSFPRFYIDADVIVPYSSVEKTASTLAQRNDCLAAAPLMNIDYSDRSYFVKAFYRVWLSLPYCRNGMIGSGVYALSENGRKRFDKFPNITADDGYVRLLFQPHERLTIQSCTFTIVPPKTLAGIIKIKTRAYFGSLELLKYFPELRANEITAHASSLKSLCMRPCWWGPLIIYFYVRVISRTKAWLRFRFWNEGKWDRDETSRYPLN